LFPDFPYILSAYNACHNACRECGWRERTVLRATNKPTVRYVVIMAKAKNADIEKKRKEKKQ
jgi:hypothetical protein